MTYVDEIEVRRPPRGTKVLGFGVAILALLGSFWGIVWFIRSYVEPPRVMRPSPLALASRDSTPVTLPPVKLAEPAVTGSTPAEPVKSEPIAAVASPTAASSIATHELPAPAPTPMQNGLSDRWASADQFAPSAAVAAPAPSVVPPAPSGETATISAPTALTSATPDADVVEDVAES